MFLIISEIYLFLFRTHVIYLIEKLSICQYGIIHLIPFMGFTLVYQCAHINYKGKHMTCPCQKLEYNDISR